MEFMFGWYLAMLTYVSCRKRRCHYFFTKRFNVIDIDLTQPVGTDVLLPRGKSGQSNTIGINLIICFTLG